MLKPKGKNKLKPIEVIRFKTVLKDIKAKGSSDTCPFELSSYISDCRYCYQAFPKSQKGINFMVCPCGAGYSKPYLIKRVTEIIKTERI